MSEGRVESLATVIPENRAQFELEEMIGCVDGELLQLGSNPVAVGVSTDSRRVGTGNIFVALQGDRYDGHDHVGAASDAGAAVLIVSRPVEARSDTAVVCVEDTLLALGKLAKKHRDRWAQKSKAEGLHGQVVGVTGSAGKTTTCRAVSAVLDAICPGDVHVPAGNLNNAIGVPMVLLGLGDSHGQVVVEIGTNRPGEVAYASGLAQPDISVLTLVACAHTEGLGSVEAVAREKGEIFAALGSEGVCVANADDEHVRMQIKGSKGARILTFGRSPHASVR
ncbi:MAG: UDP-N-acetylmuramoylalanyl-D-glutamyl-2, 6-diaminopimelate--D-alanyl-D-alanine ligase, partial [Sorangium cellulosum]